MSDAAPTVRRVHPDQIDPANRARNAEPRLAHPPEQKAHEAPVRLCDQRHPWRTHGGDVQAPMPVLLARLPGQLLVDPYDGVQITRLHRSHVDAGSTHRGPPVRRPPASTP